MDKIREFVADSLGPLNFAALVLHSNDDTSDDPHAGKLRVAIKVPGAGHTVWVVDADEAKDWGCDDIALRTGDRISTHVGNAVMTAIAARHEGE